MIASSLSGGFQDGPIQSACAFRAILEAFSRPGTRFQVSGALPPEPLPVAAGVALLTLADGTTPVHLAGAVDCEVVRQWISFHVGCPLVEAGRASFAVGRWDDLLPLDRFAHGDPDYPDRSATLIVLCDNLNDTGARLTGPGIETETFLSLPETRAFQGNRALFPLGLDFLFAAGEQIAGLPRSTKVEDV